jgi:tetratricopeptide (TPR) repeat protein
MLRHLATFPDKQKEAMNLVIAGIRQYEAQMLDKAEQTFSESLRISSNGDAYYNRGVVQMDKKNIIAAITDFSAAILLMPNYRDAHHNRGLCVAALLAKYGVMKDVNFNECLEFARADFNKAISLGLNKSAEFLKMTY